MTLLNDIDVGGTKYRYANSIPMGTCATPAGTAIKESAFADDFELSAGNLISVTFTYANTYGDGSTTYPSLKIGSYTYPIKYPTGAYAASGAWANGQAVTFMFDGTNLIMTHPVATEVQARNNLPVSSAAVAEALYRTSIYSEILNNFNNAWYLGKENYEGIFFTQSNATNAPTVTPYSWFVKTLHKKYNTNGYVITQIAINTDPYMIYTRTALSTDNETWTWQSWQKVATSTKNVVSNTVNLTTSNTLTGYGDYLSIAVPPGAFVSGQLSAVYRYSEPLQTSIFAGANPTSMTSFLKLSDNDSGYCAFSFYNSSGSTQYLVPAVRYQDNGYAIEPGDISISLIIM